MGPRIDSPGRSGVTAVIVSHDGERWIPRLLSALEAGSVRPDSVVCVDTGSRDSSAELLGEAFGAAALVPAPATTGFGDAVRLGLAAQAADGLPPHDWVWLLHDDCAPAPDALERLLATAATDESIAVVGCRLRSWPRGRRLLEVGVTMSGTGRRDTGLEPGEYDQGQLDEVRRVLAVSSAGMLVRRSVWDQLGGFEPSLPLFRDDVDFGWRVARAGWRVVVSPNAVIFHSEAATRGVRAIANTSTSPHRADRSAALFTLLANTSALSLPWQCLRLVGGTLLRAVGYLVGKLPAAAGDEVAALMAVAVRPGKIVAARVARKKTSAVSASQLRPLFPPWSAPYLDGLDALLSRFGRPRSTQAPGSGRPYPRLRPAFLVLIGLLVVASAVAARGLLGQGLLHGGGLLPAPGGAADWWRLYGETRHGAAYGSELVTAPYVVPLGLAGTILLGKAWLVVDLLMLLAVPLAATGAYVAAGRLVSSVPVRLWMAAAYGLTPVLSGSVTTGHLGTVAADIALPWLVLAAARLLEAPTWQWACSCGGALAVVVAFAPLAEPMAIALLVVGGGLLVGSGQAKAARYTAVAVALPVVLLAPWSLRVLADPGSLLAEAGLPDASTRRVAAVAWQLPFGRLGAPGGAPWWLTAGVLLAAVCSVLRRDRRSAIATAWIVLAVALGTAAAVSFRVVTLPLTGDSAAAWLGLPVVVAQGAAVVAAGVAADGLLPALRGGAIGVRRLLVMAVGVTALAAPVAGTVWWVSQAPHGELSRPLSSPLPAYMSDALVSDPSLRALVIRSAGSGVSYQLVAGPGLRLGDDSVLPRREWRGLTSLVSNLLTEPRPAAARRLAALGVSYVVLPAPSRPATVAALDRVPGLTRASTDVSRLDGWQVARGSDEPGSARSAQRWAATSSAASQPDVLSQHRPVWLAGSAAAWLVTLVLAMPSLSRRDPGWEEDR